MCISVCMLACVAVVLLCASQYDHRVHKAVRFFLCVCASMYICVCEFMCFLVYLYVFLLVRVCGMVCVGVVAVMCACGGGVTSYVRSSV